MRSLQISVVLQPDQLEGLKTRRNEEEKREGGRKRLTKKSEGEEEDEEEEKKSEGYCDGGRRRKDVAMAEDEGGLEHPWHAALCRGASPQTSKVLGSALLASRTRVISSCGRVS